MSKTRINVKDYKDLRSPRVPEPIACDICNSVYGDSLVRINHGKLLRIYAHKKCVK